MTRPSEQSRLVLKAVWFTLFATGWAANHFAAMLPVLAHGAGLSHAALDGAYGIYAVGLLPGLVGGGSLSDNLGRRPLLLIGATVAALGNLSLLCWHDQTGILVGRIIVGVGVGVTMSAGTAWSADLGGGTGSAAAGVFLSAGFGCGPLVSGLVAQFATSAITAPFYVTIALSTMSIAVAAFSARTPADPGYRLPDSLAVERAGHPTGVWTALSAALPMAMWVFSCATVAIVTMAERMQYRYSGPWLPGVAGAITLAVGVSVQALARRRGWGRATGVAGAVTAALGFGAAAATGAKPSLAVFVFIAAVLGAAYGMCLRAGLVDVETLAPPRRRGTLTGIFYAVTYLGFGLPVLLEAMKSWAGTIAPLAALTVLAVGVALLRVVQIRHDTRARRAEPVDVVVASNSEQLG